MALKDKASEEDKNENETQTGFKERAGTTTQTSSQRVLGMKIAGMRDDKLYVIAYDTGLIGRKVLLHSMDECCTYTAV